MIKKFLKDWGKALLAGAIMGAVTTTALVVFYISAAKSLQECQIQRINLYYKCVTALREMERQCEEEGKGVKF